MTIVTNLSAVHRDVTDMMQLVYGDRLVKIVLFGSYARGDFHEDSDVDYLIVLADEVVSTFTEVKHISPLKTDYYLTTGIVISPVVVAASQLAESMKPFFKEVRKDKKLICERRPTYLQKAERYLGSAKLLAASEYPNGAVTDSYYAFFWAIRGLLYEKGIITKRHSGLKDVFGLHYVKGGTIPKHFAEDLEILYDRRQLVDYDVDGELPIEEINECIRKAEEFLAFVTQKYA